MAALGECVAGRRDRPGARSPISPTEVDADLVVVGPEDPLVAGVVDAVQARGPPRVRPDRGRRPARGFEGVDEGRARRAPACRPPRYGAFGAGDEAPRSRSSTRSPGLYVVKTDGLAAGKGVIVTESLADARDAVRAYLVGRRVRRRRAARA